MVRPNPDILLGLYDKASPLIIIISIILKIIMITIIITVSRVKNVESDFQFNNSKECTLLISGLGTYTVYDPGLG